MKSQQFSHHSRLSASGGRGSASRRCMAAGFCHFRPEKLLCLIMAIQVKFRPKNTAFLRLSPKVHSFVISPAEESFIRSSLPSNFIRSRPSPTEWGRKRLRWLADRIVDLPSLPPKFIRSSHSPKNVRSSLPPFKSRGSCGSPTEWGWTRPQWLLSTELWISFADNRPRSGGSGDSPTKVTCRDVT